MCTAEILEYLSCFTDVNTYPTSDIINKIMVDFIMKQRSPHVAQQSCRYLEQVRFGSMYSQSTRVTRN